MSHTIDRTFEIREFADFREELQCRGWSVLAPSAVTKDPADTLRRVGRIVPQYNGLDTFDVTYKPGFDDAPYSQSMNGLGAHTEAPGYEPPPKYLALYCHRAARCGKGQTLLADGVRFYDEVMAPELRDWASATDIAFVAATKPGSSEKRSLRAPIRGTYKGEPILRFSYNLFRYGNVNPTADDVIQASEPTTPLARIAEAGEAFFADNLIPVLVPDGCMLVWNNHRLIHGRGQFSDAARHLTRYWLA